MKNYPYNRSSAEGHRVFHLLKNQYNEASFEEGKSGKIFQTDEVPVIMQCQTNKVRLLFAGNHSGMRRPLIQVEADVMKAWGKFAHGVDVLEFVDPNEEPPLTYIQPLEDETIKKFIDAGLYRDEEFEAVLSSLMRDEIFEADATMMVTHLNLGDDHAPVPVMLIDPLRVVHEKYDPSENTNIQSMARRSAQVAIELKKEGVKTEDLVQKDIPEDDKEIYLTDLFEDVTSHVEPEPARDLDGFVAKSEYLDAEIDVTDKLKGSLVADLDMELSEEERIRELKDQVRAESFDVTTKAPEEEVRSEEKVYESRVFAPDTIIDLDDYDEDDLEL